MKKNNFLFPAALAALILSDPALAAAGTQSLNNTLQTKGSMFPFSPPAIQPAKELRQLNKRLGRGRQPSEYWHGYTTFCSLPK